MKFLQLLGVFPLPRVCLHKQEKKGEEEVVVVAFSLLSGFLVYLKRISLKS